MKRKRLDRADPEAVSKYLLAAARQRGGERHAEALAFRLQAGGLDAIRALVSDKRLHQLQRESALLAIAQDLPAQPQEQQKLEPYPATKWKRIARRARELIEALEELPEGHALEPHLWADVPRIAEFAEGACASKRRCSNGNGSSSS